MKYLIPLILLFTLTGCSPTAGKKQLFCQNQNEWSAGTPLYEGVDANGAIYYVFSSAMYTASQCEDIKKY